MSEAVLCRNNLLSERRLAKQATFASDGAVLMERSSLIQFLTNCAISLLVTIFSQVDPILLPRVDPKKITSAITYVDDGGKRVQCPEWNLAPGWHGQDVCIGTDYSKLLKSSFDVDAIQDLCPKDIIRLWNSDTFDTPHPYNNLLLTKANDVWRKHTNAQGANIPLNVIASSDKTPAVCTRSRQSRLGGCSSLWVLNKI